MPERPIHDYKIVRNKSHWMVHVKTPGGRRESTHRHSGKHARSNAISQVAHELQVMKECADDAALKPIVFVNAQEIDLEYARQKPGTYELVQASAALLEQINDSGATYPAMENLQELIVRFKRISIESVVANCVGES